MKSNSFWAFTVCVLTSILGPSLAFAAESLDNDLQLEIDLTGEQSISAAKSLSKSPSQKAQDTAPVASLANPITVSLSTSTNSIAEASGSATITATLSQSLSSNSSVIVTLSHAGTATAGSDYANPSTVISIPMFSRTGSTTLTALQDTILEGPETIIVDIVSATDGVVENGVQQQTISIIDDEQVNVSLSLAKTTMAEQDGSTTLTATLDKATFEPVVVNLLTGGGATSGSDYSLGSNVLTIPAGSTTASTALTIIDDSSWEQNQSGTIDISSVSGGNAVENGVQQQTFTIIDNEPHHVKLRATGASINEAGGSTTVEAYLEQITYADVTVYLSFSGTAGNGADYTASATSITIPAGQISKSITISANQDTTFEPNETIVVDISGVQASGIAQAIDQAQTITLTDDETVALTLSGINAPMVEASGKQSVSANLAHATFEDVVVQLAFSDSATKDVDYTASATSITIPAGQTSGSIDLTAIQDTDVEVDEIARVTIASISGGNAVESGNQYFAYSIIDDDLYGVTLTTEAVTSPESEIVNLTATLAQPMPRDIKLSIEYAGTLRFLHDFNTTKGTVDIPAGETTGTFALWTFKDWEIEPTETITFSLRAYNRTVAVAPEISITNVDFAEVSFERSTTSIGEDYGQAVFTATISRKSFEDVYVDFNFTGSAVLNSDFTVSPSRLRIPAGQTKGTMTVTATPDSIIEATEELTATMSAISGGHSIKGGFQQHSLLVLDHDQTLVNLSLGKTSFAEHDGTTNVTVSLDKPTFEPVVVNLAPNSSQSANGSDYTLGSTSVTIPAGMTSATTTLTIVDDTTVESNETGTIEITGVSGGKAVENSSQQQSFLIIDNEPKLVSLQTSASSVNEAAGSVTVEFQIPEYTWTDVVINPQFSGTATLGSDYTVSSNTVTIPQGQTSASMTIAINDDSLVEAAETILVDVGTVSAAGTPAPAQQKSIVIHDDDKAEVTLTVSSGDLAEAAGTGTLTATMSQAAIEDVTVSLSFSGDAIANTDFGLSAPSIVVPAGKTTASVTVTATHDDIVEADEKIIATVASVSGGHEIANGTQQQTLTIADDDKATLELFVDTTTLSETVGNTVITVRMDKPSFEPVKIDLAFTGSAVQGNDYTVGSTSLTIAAGATTAITSINVADDLLVEEDETIVIDIAAVSGGKGAESGQQQQTITVGDNDFHYVSLAKSADTMAEGSGSASVTAHLSSASANDVLVSLSYFGLATKGEDYLSQADTLTIAAGQLSATTRLTAVDDNEIESDEIIMVDIAEVTGHKVKAATEQVQEIVITDNESVAVSLAVENGFMDENEGFDTILATLDRPAAANVSVNLSFSGSATQGVDYGKTAKTIVIEPGETSKSLVVAAKQDTSREEPETIIIDIVDSKGVNATTAGATQHTITINDDDQIGPAEYGVSIDVNVINKANAQQFAFTLLNAEVGTTYSYKIADSTNHLIEGAGDVTATEMKFSDIDVSGFAEGMVSLVLRLTDKDGHVGSPASAEVQKNTLAPVLWIDSPKNDQVINDTQPQLSFSFDSIVETGTTDNLIKVHNLKTDEVLFEIASNDNAIEYMGSHVNVVLPVTLPRATSFYVTIGKGAFSDMSGNPFAGIADNSQWRFSITNPELQPADDFASVDEDSKVVIDVLSNDISNDSKLNPASVKVVTNAVSGKAVVNVENGQITYTPDADFNGDDSFTYQVMDLNDAISLPVTVDVNVMPVDDAPTALNDVAQVNLDTSSEIDVLRNDFDVDGLSELDDMTLVIAANPQNGQVSVSSGQITYVPATGFQGSDSFTYKVSDFSGLTSNEATVYINVQGTNMAPQGVEDLASVDEHAAVDIDVLANDFDDDGTVNAGSVVIVTQAAGGSLEVLADGKVRYSANADFVGIDSFTYIVQDDQGAYSDLVNVEVTVKQVNDAPVAGNDVAHLVDGQPMFINVLANDVDVDHNMVAIVIDAQPLLGTVKVSFNGYVEYTPDSVNKGEDTFSYQVIDSDGAKSSATVLIR